MPLEATMLIIDNSEYMRNGDYAPTRFDAQSDAVNVVFQAKIDSNPESTVGVMTMAGKGPEVLVTHTKDLGQILQGLHSAKSKIGGEIDIPTAIAVAQLALKHRENKNLRQRIIVFAGSPPGPTGPGQEAKGKDAMVALAKKLKKNNVAVDIVSFGDGIEEESDEGVLKAFVETVNNNDNSHLLVSPPGNNLLSDSLITSPILSGDRSASIPEALGGTGGGAGPSAAGGSGGDFEFGVDPSLDPELAMALRMSMQEAQAREAAEAARAGATAAETAAPAAPAAQPASVPADPTDDEEDALLQQAIALSRAENQGEGDDGDVEMDDGEEEEEEDEEEEDDDDEEEDDEEEEDEDQAIARAIEMSLRGQEGQNKGPQGGEKGQKK
ncbi:hypothetical protein CVT24_010493 [Panaeolus cyanescens]|uniref:VWFA domain-containing protein n=1 Tax=Panaeolus cyanescens TaxID=181874 RepID=A0A409YLT7_9AGAR|nr:hypothetical protein CVT24_010493 [Panaeolus cyanescens]